jgi:hypothetical protein
MSGKTGSKPTGRKPQSVRRQSAKADGASGKESREKVQPGGAAGNMDKAVARRGRTRTATS